MNNTHHLADCLQHKGYFIDVNSAYLKRVDINSAEKSLLLDMDSFFVNAIVTYASLINSLNLKNYSWAFIQSYYCLFFLSKTYLAINGIGIVYANKKPFKIKIIEGEKFIKAEGNSHEVAMNFFKNELSGDFLLSNNIEGKNPIDWFRKNRETINYKLNPLSDPIAPLDLFEYNSDLRKWITTYLNDNTGSYVFSANHAYIAYTTRFLDKIFNYYSMNKIKNAKLKDYHLPFFKDNICDKKGPINSIISKISDIIETE